MRRRNSYGYRRKSSIWPKLLILLLIVGAGAYYVYTSPMFERVKPTITTQEVIYSGTTEPLKVVLEDNMGLAQYNAVFSSGTSSIVAASGTFDMPIKKTEVLIPFPKQMRESKEGTKWKLTIYLKDKSFWNYIQDNRAIKTMEIEADTKPPFVAVIAKSATMARGGSALIVFKAKDANLKEAYVISGGIKFKATPYRKKGYYATLIAWPFKKKRIKIYVEAVDVAGNKSRKKVIFPKVHRQYRVSKIRLSDRFIDGKIVDVAEMDPDVAQVKDRLKKFRAVNEDMRIGNEKLIHKLAKQKSFDMIDHWKVKAFYPLKSGKLVADFGDERHYYYKNKDNEVSISYHVGYDMASTRHAPIISSNKGIVTYAALNGIYGNMPLINHGFGLSTLYGHCSRLLVEEDEEIEAGQMIARSGKTGLALGDHLHFGVLIHGVEVWPMDWMKGNWIKKNIDKVFKSADKVIGK